MLITFCLHKLLAYRKLCDNIVLLHQIPITPQMGLENNYNAGNQGSNFKWQLAMLQTLGQSQTTLASILAAVGTGSGNEIYTTTYRANGNGNGFSTGDFITRIDIINAVTGVIVKTIFFNETTGVMLALNPAIAQLDPYIPKQIQLPATLGQGTMDMSLSVVIASNQTAVAVTLPTGAQVITSTSDATGAGSPIIAGATSVGFTTSSTFSGTINGIARSASTFYGFESAMGKTLPQIAYTVTAGSVIIDKIV